MLRRLSTLGVLLLSLSGLVPASACAPLLQSLAGHMLGCDPAAHGVHSGPSEDSGQQFRQARHSHQAGHSQPAEHCGHGQHPCAPASAAIGASGPMPEGTPCCELQPAPVGVIAAATQLERRADECPTPNHESASLSDPIAWNVRSRSRSHPPACGVSFPDQQQIYLRTGRLRL